MLQIPPLRYQFCEGRVSSVDHVLSKVPISIKNPSSVKEFDVTQSFTYKYMRNGTEKCISVIWGTCLYDAMIDQNYFQSEGFPINAEREQIKYWCEL